MKKFLSIIIGLFIIISIFNIGNITTAQQHKGQNNGGTSTIGSTNGAIPEGCLTGMGKGCFSFDEIIHGKDSEITATNKNRTVTTIAQDIILAATYMVGTVLTIIIIYCGLMYIFSASNGKDTSKYKKGLINAAIGAILVRGAYAIVRLIQYIAKG